MVIITAIKFLHRNKYHITFDLLETSSLVPSLFLPTTRGKQGCECCECCWGKEVEMGQEREEGRGKENLPMAYEMASCCCLYCWSFFPLWACECRARSFLRPLNQRRMPTSHIFKQKMGPPLVLNTAATEEQHIDSKQHQEGCTTVNSYTSTIEVLNTSIQKSHCT